MNPIVKRILLFISGFVLALGAALSNSPEGAELTISQMGQVTLVSWLFSIGAGITGAMNGGTTNKGEKT